MSEEVFETSLSMITDLRVQFMIPLQGSESKESSGRPVRIPVPKLCRVGCFRQAWGDAGIGKNASRGTQEIGGDPSKVSQ